MNIGWGVVGDTINQKQDNVIIPANNTIKKTSISGVFSHPPPILFVFYLEPRGGGITAC